MRAIFSTRRLREEFYGLPPKREPDRSRAYWYHLWQFRCLLALIRIG
ncbi:MAG: hypothetical protein ABSD56_06475 [Bryobacteraceae bacterium]